MENFTPYSAFAGGLLIGAASLLLLLFSGRIAGISGIMSGLIKAPRNDFFWRSAFLIGIVIGSFLFHQIKPEFFQARTNFPFGYLVMGGFLVGLGTRMGNGCTSGHAVCGIARLSLRSLVATVVFMTAGFITVFIVRHLLG